jgi:hypothetical protein
MHRVRRGLYQLVDIGIFSDECMSIQEGLYRMSFHDLIGESSVFKSGLDCPVKPDNDNHWNRVRYE